MWVGRSLSGIFWDLLPSALSIKYSYTLSREYRVVKNRYSRLLFTSEHRLCANLRVQEQSTNMTSQCQCLAFIWRHRSTVMTVPSDNGEMSDRSLFAAERYVQNIKQRVRNKIIHSLPWITIFWSLMRWFANDFHSWLRHSWKSLANHPTRDQKNCYSR